MISREFIYEFSNFDDIKSRENDKKSRAHDIFAHAIGVWYKFEGISYKKVGCRTGGAAQNCPKGSVTAVILRGNARPKWALNGVLSCYGTEKRLKSAENEVLLWCCVWI